MRGMTARVVHIIEDEPLHASLLDRALRQAHFDTAIAVDGCTGWDDVQRLLPSVIILDLMLPGLTGRELCWLVRSTPSTRHIPIIMLTAVGSDEDRIEGLSIGADDYVVKPFSPREVVSRVQAVLRRTSALLRDPEPFSEHPIKVEGSFFVVSLRQRQVSISKWELKVLRYMLSREGELLKLRDFLHVSGEIQDSAMPREFDQRIRLLRRKLENSEIASIEILPDWRYRLRVHP